jgi:glycerophosphoryl diester phosphodiesterase
MRNGAWRGHDRVLFREDGPDPDQGNAADWDNITVPGALIRTRKDGKEYNALAGPMRNEQMAQYADALIAVWNGVSTGTGDMIDRMRKYNKRLLVWDVTEELDLI